MKDHKERERLSNKSSTGSGMNYGNVPKWVTGSSNEPTEVRRVFDEIETTHNFSQSVLKNLSAYFSGIAGKAAEATKSRS